MRGSFIQSFTGSLSPISYSSHYFVNFLSLLFSSFILFSSVFLSFVFFHLPSIILSSFHLCSSLLPSLAAVMYMGYRYTQPLQILFWKMLRVEESIVVWVILNTQWTEWTVYTRMESIPALDRSLLFPHSLFHCCLVAFKLWGVS